MTVFRAARTMSGTAPAAPAHLFLLALLLAGCAARGAVPRLAPEVAALGRELDSALADPAFARSTWGVVIESADDGAVLYRRDAGKLLIPASNLKLLTAAAALARLGADFRWTTTALARGARRDDTLAGDLVIVGRGDPTFAVDAIGDSTDELAALRPWVDSLTARGIRVIRGRVVGDASAFVLLANNVTAPRRVAEAAQDRIVERLANFIRAAR